MSKTQELDVIKSGTIQYRDIDIQEVSVRIIGTTAIVLNKSSGCSGWRQRGHESFRGHGGVRAGRRQAKAGYARVYAATDSGVSALDAAPSAGKPSWRQPVEKLRMC